MSYPKVSSKKIIFFGIVIAILWLCLGNLAWAESRASLQDVQVHTLPEDRIQLEFAFSRPVSPPRSFAVDNPNSIILDFNNVSNRLPKKLSNQTFALGMLKGLNVVEGRDKTRVVINLNGPVPHTTEVRGNHVIITMSAEPNSAAFRGCEESRDYQIQSFDFRRGSDGEGRLIFNVSSPKAAIDFTEENGKIMARFYGACIQESISQAV